MPRISIKSHHSQYLQMIASQMGCDQTEALNHILWTARQAGFSFSSPLPSAPVHPPQTPESRSAATTTADWRIHSVSRGSTRACE
jgi:hypothetical protein